MPSLEFLEMRRSFWLVHRGLKRRRMPERERELQWVSIHPPKQSACGGGPACVIGFSSVIEALPRPKREVAPNTKIRQSWDCDRMGC